MNTGEMDSVSFLPVVLITDKGAFTTVVSCTVWAVPMMGMNKAKSSFFITMYFSKLNHYRFAKRLYLNHLRSGKCGQQHDHCDDDIFHNYSFSVLTCSSPTRLSTPKIVAYILYRYLVPLLKPVSVNVKADPVYMFVSVFGEDSVARVIL